MIISDVAGYLESADCILTVGAIVTVRLINVYTGPQGQLVAYGKLLAITRTSENVTLHFKGGASYTLSPPSSQYAWDFRTNA